MSILDRLSYTTLPAEAEALRQPLRAFLREALGDQPVDRRARSWAGCSPAFSRALGEAGYLGLTLPAKYGGSEHGPFARFVVVEELLAIGAPVAAHWIADRQSALQILHFGSEAQRERFLPAICRGESFFCIGMSESNAGSDLAGVRTRADRDGDGWRLNGQKIWTTSAAVCGHMIALVRTSGGPEDRHHGLSQMIVDLTAPGVTIRPIADLTGDAHFAEVFFDDVQLGEGALIGREGDGWKQVTAELAFERSGPERIYSSLVLLDAWIDELKQRARIDEGTQKLIGQLTAQLTALRALSIAVTAKLAEGESPVFEASLVKDLGTAFEQSIPALVADDLASRPDETVSPELWRALFYTSWVAPTFSLRGGTREILRGIIARGLGVR